MLSQSPLPLIGRDLVHQCFRDLVLEMLLLILLTSPRDTERVRYPTLGLARNDQDLILATEGRALEYWTTRLKAPWSLQIGEAGLVPLGWTPRCAGKMSIPAHQIQVCLGMRLLGTQASMGRLVRTRGPPRGALFRRVYTEMYMMLLSGRFTMNVKSWTFRHRLRTTRALCS